jgi:hypothetical protein
MSEYYQEISKILDKKVNKNYLFTQNEIQILELNGFKISKSKTIEGKRKIKEALEKELNAKHFPEN